MQLYAIDMIMRKKTLILRRMRVLGKSRIRCLSRVRQFENEVGFAAKIKVEFHFLKLWNAQKVPFFATCRMRWSLQFVINIMIFSYA